MGAESFDVIVIGGGPGGIAAAIRAAQLGGRVALIEQEDLGGLCMNRGCIPLCHMMVASSILGHIALGKEMGLMSQGLEKDYSLLIKRQQALIEFMRQGAEAMLRKNAVRIVRGRGRLEGTGRVSVNKEVIFGKNIILATGGRWTRSDLPGGDSKGISNSDYLLSARALPRRCLVYGGGPISLEIAQFLKRFGSEVFLVTEHKSLLHGESKAVRSRLSKALQKEGIKVYTKTRIQSLEKKKNELHCLLKSGEDDEKIVVGRLFTVERQADLTDLGLTTVGLETDGPFLEVNERMQTSVDGVYAVGDISAPETMAYSHAASAGGIIAAENAMGLDSKFDTRIIARVAFTQPQVACVGYTKKEAKKAGYDVIAGTAPLSMNPLGMILSQNEGIIEVVSEKKYGEMLGIHIVGENAAEMAGQAVLAMHMELYLEELARVPFPHPTLSESLPEAARDALGRAIYLP